MVFIDKLIEKVYFIEYLNRKLNSKYRAKILTLEEFNTEIMQDNGLKIFGYTIKKCNNKIVVDCGDNLMRMYYLGIER